MAYEQALRAVGIASSTDLSAYQYHLVSLDHAGQLALPLECLDVVGVLQDKPDGAGGDGQVAISGISRVVVGDGGVTAGDYLATYADGSVGTADLGNKIVGRALATGVAGTIIPMLIQPLGVNTTYDGENWTIAYTS